MNWRLILLIAAIILFVVAGIEAMDWIHGDPDDYGALLAFGLAAAAASRLP